MTIRTSDSNLEHLAVNDRVRLHNSVGDYNCSGRVVKVERRTLTVAPFAHTRRRVTFSRRDGVADDPRWSIIYTDSGSRHRP